MWALDNVTPFAADRAWVRDRNGAEIWLVAVKATFNIAPDGSTHAADEQVPVFLAPKFSGEPGKSSLLYDTDLPRTKVTTDIIINGHAFSPGREPVTLLKVGFRVGSLQKSLWVTGDRLWKGGLLGVRLARAVPFVKMPITYERAYGGTDEQGKKPKWDPRNPVGTGVISNRGRLVGQRAPNIHAERPGWFSRFRASKPAGFGVIAGHWMPRVRLAGTCDAKWEAERAPLLPGDFDDRFHQCAPRDQQTQQFLKGGEEVELFHLTTSGHLAFYLPRVILGFETDFGNELTPHRGSLHTVIIEPDFPRVQMVWHTALPCHAKVTKLKSTRITEKRLLSRSASVPVLEEKEAVA